MLRFSARGHYAEAIDATRLLCADGAPPHDRRTTQDTKKFPPVCTDNLSPGVGVVKSAKNGV
jgi:hypothetical protein